MTELIEKFAIGLKALEVKISRSQIPNLDLSSPNTNSTYIHISILRLLVLQMTEENLQLVDVPDKSNQFINSFWPVHVRIASK